MKLNIDSPFFQMISRVADFIVLNLLFVACCIPVVTIGAAIAGMNKAVQDVVFQEEGHLYRRFFSAFKSNFKQSTIVWLITLVILAGLAADVFLIMTYFAGSTRTTLYALLGVLALVVTATLSYMFPLMVRYENTLRELVYNSLVLAICKLPRTLLMCLLVLAPFLLLWFYPYGFLQTLVFWVFVGMSLIAYACNAILKPIFRELESGSVSVMK